MVPAYGEAAFEGEPQKREPRIQAASTGPLRGHAALPGGSRSRRHTAPAEGAATYVLARMSLTRSCCSRSGSCSGLLGASRAERRSAHREQLSRDGLPGREVSPPPAWWGPLAGAPALPGEPARPPGPRGGGVCSPLRLNGSSSHLARGSGSSTGGDGGRRLPGNASSGYLRSEPRAEGDEQTPPHPLIPRM